MEQPISWILEVTLKPGQQQAFQTLMADLIASTQAEPGAVSYEFFGSDDGTVVLYERYADGGAALAHVTTFGQRFATRLLEIATPTQFTVLGTINDELRAALRVLGPRYLQPLGSINR